MLCLLIKANQNFVKNIKLQASDIPMLLADFSDKAFSLFRKIFSETLTDFPIKKVVYILNGIYLMFLMSRINYVKCS